tara:strand:- start:540 stop:1028 length:489 start_codon:yes stop_codon:yes gene_type:complete
LKSIVFIRHAKSAWEFQLSDEKRPLNKRGLFDAEFMSSLEILKSFQPDVVFCSSAKRTRETCDFFVKNAVSAETEVVYSDELYDFKGLRLEAFINKIDSKFSKAFIFGHNNALTAIVNQKGNQHIDNIPTCGIVKINFKSTKWSGCLKGSIEYKLFPKNLIP